MQFSVCVDLSLVVVLVVTQGNYSIIYNQATTNLAISSNETSQDKTSKALNRQSSIAIQVQDKIHKTCSFLHEHVSKQ